MKAPRIGQKYRHYKGGVYKVIAISIHTETAQVMVIYESKDILTTWARPLEMWFEEVEPGVKRFTLIEE